MNLKQAYKVSDDAARMIDAYIEAHSDKEPEYLKRVVRETNIQMINPRMMSGHLQGRTLKMLVGMINPHRILEIGTFAGYSALSMAEALGEGAVLHTIEIDDEMEDFIKEQLASVSHGDKIVLHIGDALEVIPRLDEMFDMVFIDADKRLYHDYFELVLPKIRMGGFILADNTLWDGKVLIEEPAHNDHQTIAIKEFNDKIAVDPRVERVILPLRDGLTVIRKL